MHVYMFLYVSRACSQNGFLTTQMIFILSGKILFKLRNVVSVANIVICDSLQIITTLCTQRRPICLPVDSHPTCARIFTNSIRAFVAPHKA